MSSKLESNKIEKTEKSYELNNNYFLKKTCIIAYIIDIIAHLYSCYYTIHMIRIPTKAFLMILLFVIYIQSTKKEGRCKTFIYGLLLGWLGDIALIPNHPPQILFVSGVISFLLGHILYICSIFKLVGKKNIINNFLIYLASLVFCLVMCRYQYINYLEHAISSSGCGIFGPGYLMMLGILNSASLFNFFVKKNVNSLVLLGGTIFFWISDFILVLRMFDQPNMILGYFKVMSTYITGQTLICAGLIFEKSKKEKYE